MGKHYGLPSIPWVNVEEEGVLEAELLTRTKETIEGYGFEDFTLKKQGDRVELAWKNRSVDLWMTGFCLHIHEVY